MRKGMAPKQHRQTVRLFTFMSVFGIDRFDVLSVSEQRIEAKVCWPDDGSPDYDREEETQYISWDIRADDAATDDALRLLVFLADGGYIDIDKITLSPDQIRKHPEAPLLRIDDLDRAIAALLNFTVDMVDEGEFTDQFFVHF